MLEDLGVFQVEIVKELNWKVLTAPRELETAFQCLPLKFLTRARVHFSFDGNRH